MAAILLTSERRLIKLLPDLHNPIYTEIFEIEGLSMKGLSFTLSTLLALFLVAFEEEKAAKRSRASADSEASRRRSIWQKVCLFFAVGTASNINLRPGNRRRRRRLRQRQCC